VVDSVPPPRLKTVILSVMIRRPCWLENSAYGFKAAKEQAVVLLSLQVKYIASVFYSFRKKCRSAWCLVDLHHAFGTSRRSQQTIGTVYNPGLGW